MRQGSSRPIPPCSGAAETDVSRIQRVAVASALFFVLFVLGLILLAAPDTVVEQVGVDGANRCGARDVLDLPAQLALP